MIVPVLGNDCMAVYRFYILDLVGQLIRSMRCECPDDGVAIRHAERTIDGSSVELWQDERRIGRFDTNRSLVAQTKLRAIEVIE
jgi:hypothetical protein